MANIRTSETDPLQISEVSAHPEQGKIGITFCPGKQDLFAATGAWKRSLVCDLDAICAWGATRVVTLLEALEISALKVADLEKELQCRGIIWQHLPIADYSVPSEYFERQWLIQGEAIRTALRRGDNVLIHCKGGLGRAGMIAARLLAELGMAPTDAIRCVRRARKGAIETPSQLALVKQTRFIPAP